MFRSKPPKRFRLIIFIVAVICLGLGIMLTMVDDPSDFPAPDPVEIPININD